MLDKEEFELTKKNQIEQFLKNHTHEYFFCKRFRCSMKKSTCLSYIQTCRKFTRIRNKKIKGSFCAKVTKMSHLANERRIYRCAFCDQTDEDISDLRQWAERGVKIAGQEALKKINSREKFAHWGDLNLHGGNLKAYY